MRNENRIFISILLVMALVLLLIFAVLRYPAQQGSEEAVGLSETEGTEALSEELLPEAYAEAEKTLTLRYADPGMKNYLEQCALDYFRETGIAVETELGDEIGYLDGIYADSIGEDGTYPDVYLLGADSLEEAYLLGLAAENPYLAGETALSETAVAASTLRGKAYGYPVCFDTPVFVYLTEAFTEEPTSIQAMLDFVAENDLPIEVGNLMEWDIDDEFYDFAFVGDCFTFSDEEKGRLTVTRDEALFKKKLEFLSALTESITLDAKTLSEGSVVSRLNHQATASAIVDSDDLVHLNVPYAVLPLLPLNDELSTRGCAYTEVLLVNAFSDQQDAAADFARFVMTEESAGVEELTPHFSVSPVPEADADTAAVYAAYEAAEPMPHSMDSDDFWKSLRLEIMKLF